MDQEGVVDVTSAKALGGQNRAAEIEGRQNFL